jgi:peptidoglycan/LPS O-acetylase OafA/YrhL
MAPSGQRPPKIHALTSLRFFAALYVVCYHTAWSFLPWLERGSVVGRFVDLGYISVSFFFLLSGYILSVVYLRGDGPVQRASFYRARFARVYPLFLLTLLMDVPVVLAGWVARFGVKAAMGKLATTLWGSLLMLQGWNLRFRYLDYPNWSLSVEAFLYLVFPVVGVALWKLRGKSVWIAAAVVYLGGQAAVWVVARHMSGDLAYRFPLLHLSTFALGVLLARHEALHRGDKPAGAGVLWASLIASLICLGAVAYWAQRIPNMNIRDGLLAPIFVAAIWAFAKPNWNAARWLSAPWLVVLGEASFGLYLFHIPVYNIFDWFGWSHGGVAFPVYLVVATGLSVLSFYYFETPTRRWLLKKRRAHVKETMEMASDAQ